MIHPHVVALLQQPAEREKDATERTLEFCSRLSKRSACQCMAAMNIQGTNSMERTTGARALAFMNAVDG